MGVEWRAVVLDFVQFSLAFHPILSFILLACLAYYAFAIGTFCYQMLRK